MEILPSVDWERVHPGIWLFLGAMSVFHLEMTGRELMVTSLVRPPGTRPSGHSPPPGELGTAADVRRWYLNQAAAAEYYCRSLQRRWGDWLGVVLEPEWLTAEEIERRGGLQAVEPHIHVELKRRDWPWPL